MLSWTSFKHKSIFQKSITFGKMDLLPTVKFPKGISPLVSWRYKSVSPISSWCWLTWWPCILTGLCPQHLRAFILRKDEAQGISVDNTLWHLQRTLSLKCTLPCEYSGILKPSPHFVEWVWGSFVRWSPFWPGKCKTQTNYLLKPWL